MFMPMNNNLGCSISNVLNDKNDCKPVENNLTLYFSFLSIKFIHGIGANNFILIFFSAKTHIKQEVEK